MKKIIVCMLMFVMTLVFASCGSNESDSSENQKTVTENTTTESEKGFKAEDLKEEYTEMPKDTEEYLNVIMQYSNKIFPDVDGDWRYGYKGKETINKENCFVFTAFIENDDSNSKIGSVAVAEKSKNIYVLNETNNEYELFDPQDDSSK